MEKFTPNLVKVVSIPAPYLGGHGFNSHPIHRLSFLTYVVILFHLAYSLVIPVNIP